MLHLNLRHRVPNISEVLEKALRRFCLFFSLSTFCFITAYGEISL